MGTQRMKILTKRQSPPDRCPRLLDESYYCDSPMLLVVYDDVLVERCANFGHIRQINNVLPERTGFTSWLTGDTDDEC